MNDDYETHPPLSIARLSSHRPAAIQLPDDPQLAAALVLAHVNGQSSIDSASAIEALNARVSELTATDPESAIGALGEQLPILNALWLKFTVECVNAKTSEARAAFLKLALSAQRAFARTQTLVIGLRAQGEGRARVVVGDDS